MTTLTPSPPENPRLDYQGVPFNQLTVPDLRQIAHHHNIRLTGRHRKQQIIEGLIAGLNTLQPPQRHPLLAHLMEDPRGLAQERRMERRVERHENRMRRIRRPPGLPEFDPELGELEEFHPEPPPRRRAPEAPAPIRRTIDPALLAPTDAQLTPTPRPQEERKINPYLLVPDAILREIVREREVALVGSREEKIQQLLTYDEIFPEYLEGVRNIPVENLPQTPLFKLMFYGALRGINYLPEYVRALGQADLVVFTRLALLWQERSFPLPRSCYGILQEAPVEVLEAILLQGGMAADTVPLLSEETKATLVATGRTDHQEPQLEQLKLRYQRLRGCPHRNLLERLYGFEGRCPLSQLIRLPPHQLEEVVLRMGTDPDTTIVATLGMLPPLSAAEDLREYLISNFLGYREIFTRDPTKLQLLTPEAMRALRPGPLRNMLLQFTDREIFTMTQAFIPYTSRESLIGGMIETLSQPRWFTPLVKPSKYCLNPTTTLLTPTGDPQDPTFMIAYGTLTGYRCYELEELLGSFHATEEGIFSFSKPEDPKHVFQPEEINQCLTLLRMYPAVDPISALIKHLKAGLEMLRENTDYDRATKRVIMTSSEEEKKMVKDLLHKVFLAGMYMRRWQGEGHGWPLDKKSTQFKFHTDEKKNAEIIENRVNEALRVVYEARNRLPKVLQQRCWTLKLVNYDEEGRFRQTDRLLDHIMKRLLSKDECIRMASSQLVGTGSHYLRVFFGETIPGFDKTLVTAIM